MCGGKTRNENRIQKVRLEYKTKTVRIQWETENSGIG